MTAYLFGSELQISLGGADDAAELSSDGTNYILRGSGLTGYSAAKASVNSVAVAGTQAVNQSFRVVAGVGAVLTDPLSVAASVERTTIVGAVDTVGNVVVDSPAITLAGDVWTTGQQRYKGAVGLVGTRLLSAGTGGVTFQGTVDSSPEVFVDPDAFAAGTVLTTAYPGITLSAAGEADAGVVVGSQASDVATPTTGRYAPTGNRVFAGKASDSAWNAPGNVFKAAFASAVSEVSIDFAGNDRDDPNAYLEAYDAAGTLVASSTFPSAIEELTSVTLTVSAPSIAYVLASFDVEGGNAGLLDNLRATYVTTPEASLTVNSAGVTTFGGAVGGDAALARLRTDAAGTTAINGGIVKTTSAAGQTYNDAVTLGRNFTVDAGAGPVTFAGSVTGVATTWARRAGGTSSESGTTVSVLPDGSAIVAGSFVGTASFGSTTLTSSGSYDVVVAKVDSTGNFMWAKKAGGTGDDDANDVSVLPDGSAVVVGSFYGTASFGSTTLTSSGSSDIFVAKLDAAGNFVWAKKAGGTDYDTAQSVSVLPDGSVIVAGSFVGTASFGSTTLTSGGADDICVVKFNAAGNVVWARKAGGTDADSAAEVSVLPEGSAVVTGRFSGTASFGSTTLTSSGADDVFVAKFNASGNVVWARKAGGTNADDAADVSVLSDGSAVVTGRFSGTASFGSNTLASSGADDGFVARLDAAGNFVWARKVGGADYDAARAVSVLPDGSAILAGHFSGTGSFGSTTLTSSGSYDVFVAKLDAAGDVMWAKKAGGTSDDYVTDVSVLSDGVAIVTGYFGGTASFGSSSLTSSGSFDMFFARIDAVGSWEGYSQLTVNSTGTTRFGGAVSNIGSLSTNAGGTTEIAGGRIATLGSAGLVFNDAVELRSDTTLAVGGSAAGGIDFKRPVNGVQTLSVAADGDVFFRGKVGQFAPLTGLSLAAARSVTFSDQIRLEGTWPKRDLNGSTIPTGTSKPFADGLTIGSNVNKVSVTAAGSIIRGFTGDGVRFLGTSTDSVLNAVTIYGNGSDGIQVDPGDFMGTRITSNTIGFASHDFTVPAGGKHVVLAGDQTHSLFVGQSVGLVPRAPAVGPVVYRTVASAGLVGGNTVVTLSSAVDATTSAGTFVIGNAANGIRLNATANGSITNLTIGGRVASSVYTGQAGSTQVVLPGDQTRSFFVGQPVELMREYPVGPVVYRTVASVGLVGGNTVVTLSSAVDATMVTGTIVSGVKTATSAGNQIAFNAHNGIFANAGTYAGTSIGDHNEITRNALNGIELGAGGVKHLTVTGNTIGTAPGGTIGRGNGRDGIVVNKGDFAGTSINGNVVAFNSADGIHLAAAASAITNLAVTGNSIFSNESDGLQADNGDYAGTKIALGNTIHANAAEGIYLKAAGGKITNLAIGGNQAAPVNEGNRISANKSSGITADAGAYGGTIVQGNTISRNGLAGITLAGNGGTLAGLLIGGLPTGAPDPLDPLQIGTPNAAPTTSAYGNMIAENGAIVGGHGIVVSSGNYAGTTIAANTIRDNGNKASHVGSGVRVLGSKLTIGGFAQPGWPNPVGNIITGNAAHGIDETGSATQDATILSNSISMNGSVVTKVDGTKQVLGEGIAAADSPATGTPAPRVTGMSEAGIRLGVFDDTLDGVVRVAFVIPKPGDYAVQLFANSLPDQRGISPVDTNGFEGRRFVGATAGSVKGTEVQTVAIPAALLGSGRWITATATSLSVPGGVPGATSPFSIAASRRPVPSAAAGVVATPRDGRAMLAWKAPAANGAAAVTDYIVQYSEDFGATWNTFHDGRSTRTSTTVTGLANGVSYVFRVAAVNPDGVGTPSVASAVVTPVAPMISASGGLVSVTTTFGTASPATVVKIGGTNLAGDIVARAPSGFEVSATNAAFGPTATFVSARGAAVGTLYVRMTAKTPVGTYGGSVVLTSPDASPASVSIPLSLVKPKVLSISGISIANKPYDGTTAATIIGTAAYSGLVAGDSFVVEGAPVASFADKNAGPGKSVTVTGYAAPGGNYTLALPAGLKATITPLALAVRADDKTRLVDAANPAFTATISGFLAGESAAAVLTGAPSLTTTATKASPFGRYAITATRGTLASPGGNYAFGPFTPGTLTVKAPPGAPPQPTATAGNAQVTLAWKAPASIGASVITGYTIQYQVSGSQDWTTFGTVSGLRGDVTKLQNGKAYVFRVAAVNAAGTGTYSAPSAAVTPATVPDAPQNFLVTQAWDGTGAVTLFFKAPGSDGGRAITSYQIESSIDDGASWGLLRTEPASALSMSVTISPGRLTYRFRVRAVNGVGGGAYTPASSPVTPYFGA